MRDETIRPESETERSCIAFAGPKRVASGTLREVARATKELVERDDSATVLVFDRCTSEPVEIDLRGTVDDVLSRLPATAAGPPDPAPVEDGGAVSRAPGRPRLGVVAREVTLLPRHWEWLAARPGGASVTLRRLVEAARRAGAEDDRRREARDAAYRFMNAIAGNEEGFEESCRALFAGNRELFEALTEPWPADVRDHARELAGRSFTDA
ncbi:MAG: DUF2239 family protein [Thermoanaerobaculia bacterium]